MRYILILLGLLVSSTASAVDCDVAPTCAELGYSQDDDPYCADNGYMYCPLDHSYKKCVNMDCDKLGFTEDDKTSWCGKLIKCKGNPLMTLCQNLCEVGDVYYADGTCGYADDYDGTKIPVGVVYWVTDDGRHGKVISLKNIKQSPWGVSDTDIPALENWNIEKTLSVAVTEDRSNPFWSAGPDYTRTIANAQNNDAQYPAQTALAFYPDKNLEKDSRVGQGHWYLPTLGELMDLYGYDYSKVSGVGYNSTGGATGKTKATVNASLNTLKGKGVEAEIVHDGYYWSSMEYGTIHSWVLFMQAGSLHYTQKFYSNHLRASLQF